MTITNNYLMSELTREFLFTYAMSMLSRYRIVEWSKIIQGNAPDDLSWKIQDYLRSTQSFFPNLLLNKLHGVQHYFFPESRVNQDEVSPDTSDFNTINVE
jgi:hypothetical protein